MNINCLLFDDFETMDLFGPIEVFGMVEEYRIKYYSIGGGYIASSQAAQIFTENIGNMDCRGILLIPGGKGTRVLVNDTQFIEKLKYLVEESEWCLTVCTGSVLVAKTGLLDDRSATSNKIAFEWVKANREEVHWKYRARWVVDEKYYTSSGISSGIDMSLGFVFDRFGEKRAKEIAKRMEYEWRNNKDDDPFAL